MITCKPCAKSAFAKVKLLFRLHKQFNVYFCVKTYAFPCVGCIQPLHSKYLNSAFIDTQNILAATDLDTLFCSSLLISASWLCSFILSLVLPNGLHICLPSVLALTSHSLVRWLIN